MSFEEINILTKDTNPCISFMLESISFYSACQRFTLNKLFLKCSVFCLFLFSPFLIRALRDFSVLDLAAQHNGLAMALTLQYSQVRQRYLKLHSKKIQKKKWWTTKILVERSLQCSNKKSIFLLRSSFIGCTNNNDIRGIITRTTTKTTTTTTKD